MRGGAVPVIEPAEFRQGLGKFATGVTVVTTRLGDELHGMTVNSLSSVSLEPPLVLFCASVGTRTLELIEQSKHYAVNVLSEDQADLCRLFASKEEKRFERFPYTPGPFTGCPLLAGCLANFECRLVASYPGGDHVILLAEVIGLTYRDGRPLLFFASGFPRLA